MQMTRHYDSDLMNQIHKDPIKVRELGECLKALQKEPLSNFYICKDKVDDSIFYVFIDIECNGSWKFRAMYKDDFHEFFEYLLTEDEMHTITDKFKPAPFRVVLRESSLYREDLNSSIYLS
jgi:hypothetical protein